MHVQQFSRRGKVDLVRIPTKLVLVENIVHLVMRHASESGLVFSLVDVGVDDKVVWEPQSVNV